MQVKANGITVNYRIDGPDRAPWLVLSNSIATTLAMWDEQAAALKDRYRVLRYDQRGHGGTEAPAGRYRFDTLLDDALALLDALSIKKTHFAGLSMGGATALGLAEKHPERFDRIIVCDSPCQSTPQSSQQWEERIAVAQKDGIAALVEPTVTRWFPPPVVAAKPAYLDKVRHMIRATPLNGFMGCAAALADHDYNSAVAAVAQPVDALVEGGEILAHSVHMARRPVAIHRRARLRQILHIVHRPPDNGEARRDAVEVERRGQDRSVDRAAL